MCKSKRFDKDIVSRLGPINYLSYISVCFNKLKLNECVNICYSI